MNDKEAFARITNLIAEMSWGIDLPSPMTVYFQQLRTVSEQGEIHEELQKIYAVDPKNYEVVFDAIRRMLEKHPLYNPYKALEEKNKEQQAEIERLSKKITTLETLEDKWLNELNKGDSDGR